MNYTKYLLIALTATSCCQLSGMDWILHPIKTYKFSAACKDAERKAKLWEASMCEAIKKNDTDTIARLEGTWQKDAFATAYDNKKVAFVARDFWEKARLHPDALAFNQNGTPPAPFLGLRLLRAIHDGDSSITSKFIEFFVEDTLTKLHSIENSDERKTAILGFRDYWHFEQSIESASRNYGADHEITKYLRSLKDKLTLEAEHQK